MQGNVRRSGSQGEVNHFNCHQILKFRARLMNGDFFFTLNTTFSGVVCTQNRYFDVFPDQVLKQCFQSNFWSSKHYVFLYMYDITLSQKRVKSIFWLIYSQTDRRKKCYKLVDLIYFKTLKKFILWREVNQTYRTSRDSRRAK